MLQSNIMENENMTEKKELDFTFPELTDEFITENLGWESREMMEEINALTHFENVFNDVKQHEIRDEAIKHGVVIEINMFKRLSNGKLARKSLSNSDESGCDNCKLKKD